MTWTIKFLPEAENDFKKLDGSVKGEVGKALLKVSQNPTYTCGYGKPLGNYNRLNLTGFLKIKLKASGTRIVYKLIQQGEEMIIVVIGARADMDVYKEALRRKTKYGL